jgi:hypothetical protein
LTILIISCFCKGISYNKTSFMGREEFSLTEEEKRYFSIHGAQQTDSVNSSGWEKYLDVDQLLDAWSPPPLSPWRKYMKTKTIESVSQFETGEIQPRLSDRDYFSYNEAAKLVKEGVAREDTAFLLNSGGAHSVAIAARLALETGSPPVVMFDVCPHPNGMTGIGSIQDLATLLYFAEHMKRLKDMKWIKPDKPPVFLLDVHRGVEFSQKDIEFYFSDRINDTYEFKRSDFPKGRELIQHGVSRICLIEDWFVYFGNEGYEKPSHNVRDIATLLRWWKKDGIEIING